MRKPAWLLAFLFVAAALPPVSAGEKLVVKRYTIGKCEITKTRRWDERQHHWDVASKRACR